MAFCYRIPFSDRYGKHTALKWGETPAAATAFLRKAHDIPGRGHADYGPPELVQPQPFSEEARAAREARI